VAYAALNDVSEPVQLRLRSFLLRREAACDGTSIVNAAHYKNSFFLTLPGVTAGPRFFAVLLPSFVSTSCLWSAREFGEGVWYGKIVATAMAGRRTFPDARTACSISRATGFAPPEQAGISDGIDACVEVASDSDRRPRSRIAGALEGPKLAGQGHLSAAVLQGLSRAVTLGLRLRLMRRASPEVATRAVEPPVEDLIRLGRPYVGPKTN